MSHHLKLLVAYLSFRKRLDENERRFEYVGNDPVHDVISHLLHFYEWIIHKNKESSAKKIAKNKYHIEKSTQRVLYLSIHSIIQITSLQLPLKA